jgi:hypothetical protein
LNLTPALISAIDALDAKGITVLDPIKRKLNVDHFVAVDLLSAKELQQAQTYFHLARLLNWLLPFLTLALAAGVVLLAEDRRRGSRRLAMVCVGAGAVSYGLLKVGIALAAPLAPTPTDVTTAVLTTVTSFLSRSCLLSTSSDWPGWGCSG